ncbi:hypothetical protein GCM10009563_25990 [Subtercola frigoramans]
MGLHADSGADARGGALRQFSFWAVVSISMFNALSAIGGGVALLATNGLGMPLSMLSAGPFSSFVGPALILLFVVGGTQTIAAVLLVRRRETGLLWSAVAGLGMIIWIFTEVGIIAGMSWLHILYFASGAAQLVLVCALLGIVGWLPRRALRKTIDNAPVDARDGAR